MRFTWQFVLLVLLASNTQAASILSFGWNDLPLGDYYLDIQLSSGDDEFGNNSATINIFNAQNVVFQPTPLLTGWASEIQPMHFEVTDNDAFTAPVPDFVNGILLPFSIASSGPGGFQLELTLTNLFSGSGLQDSLTISILNDSFFSTYEENGVGLPNWTALFDGSGSPQFVANASNVVPYNTILAPQVEESVVPEPSTWIGTLAALSILAFWRKSKCCAAVLAACFAIAPASAQKAWIVQDTDVVPSRYIAIYGNNVVRYGNDVVFAGVQSAQNDSLVGLYKFNQITRQGARFKTLPVSIDGLASAGNGLVIQTDIQNSFGIGSLWVSNGTASGTRQVVPAMNTFGRKLLLPNGVLIFNAQTVPGGQTELWRSDGSAAGTYRLAEQVSMISSTIFNGQAFFNTGQQLWKSDGTIQGTGPALGPVAGLDSIGIDVLVERAGLLYFVGCQVATGCEFWSTDGTTAGTQLAAEVIPGPGTPNSLRTLGVFNDWIFFTFSDPTTGSEIWKTNGSTATTSLVKDMIPGASSAILFNDGTALNSALLLLVRDPSNNFVIWRTDGTDSGTYSLGAVGSNRPSRLSGDVAVFVAQTVAEGIELWKTDGTLAGTSLLKDVYPGPGNGASQVHVVNGKGYFNGSTPLDGDQFWETDGTTVGTRMAYEFAKPHFGNSPLPIVSLSGFQYFLAAGNQTCDLYRTDGTNAATVRTASVPGTCALNGKLLPLDNQLIFTTASPIGTEVWKSNGTAQGTSKIGGSNGFYPSTAIQSGDRVYLELYSETFGNWQLALHVTDGVNLTLINTTPNSLPFAPRSIRHAPFGQRSLLFAAGTSTDEIELYATNGTPQGTGLLANLDPGASSNPTGLLNRDGLVYFTANVSGTAQLFQSNGTVQGTVPRLDLPGGLNGPIASDGNLADLFFRGPQLYRYNIAANTLTSLNAGNPGPEFVTRNGFTYFTAETPNAGTSIFKTDGTAAGTVSLGDIDPQFAFGPSILGLFWLGNHLYFTADVDSHRELWRTSGDATPVKIWQFNPRTASTQSVDAFGIPQNRGSFPIFLGTLPSGIALLSAEDGVRGRELWALDDAPCLAAPDLNAQLTITAAAPNINRLTGRAVQSVRIVNNGAPLQNVAYIASGLNPQHDIVNRHGFSQCHFPAGPYRDIGSIGSGQTVTVVLEFFVKPGVRFSYTPKVVAREGAR